MAEMPNAHRMARDYPAKNMAALDEMHQEVRTPIQLLPKNEGL